MIDDLTPAALDETDLALVATLQNEFVFTGSRDESNLMTHAMRDKLSLHEGIADLTGQMRWRLKTDALILGLNPELLGSHHLLVLPDYRFGASSRVHEGRHYILFNAGCMNLFSYLAEISVLFGSLSKSPDTPARRELAAWLMSDASDLALAYLHQPFGLPHLRRYIDDEMGAQEISILATVELFVYFHEAGHIELGHLGSGFGESEQEGTLPDGAEEFAADRFAMDKMLSNNPGGPMGAYILEELFLLELYGYSPPAGSVSYRDRLSALMRAFPDNFLHHELPDPIPDTVMPWERPGFDVRKTERQLIWTCEQVALLLGMEVAEPKDAPGSAYRRNTDLIANSLGHLTNTELANTMHALLEANCDLGTLRAFVGKNPVVLSQEADAWLEVAIFHAEDAGAKALWGAIRIYLQRCRVAGGEDVLPVKFAMQAFSDAASLDQQFEILRAQPHLLTDESLAYIAWHCHELRMQGKSSLARALDSMACVFQQCRTMGLDACLEHRRNVPLLPDEIWELVHALDTAEHNDDVMEQIRICNDAIALADKEAGVPTWSLPFRERLQQLPQF